MKQRKREKKAQRKSEGLREKRVYTKTTPWTDDEHNRFIEAVRLFGKNWAAITKHVGTRNKGLIASHAQLFRRQVAKNSSLKGADIIPSLVMDDKRGRPATKVDQSEDLKDCTEAKES